MTNYDKWAQEKNLPPAVKENYLNWLTSNFHDQNGDFGTFNIMFPIFKDEVLTNLTSALDKLAEMMKKARGL